MARKKLKADEVRCLGYLQRVFDLLEPLHDVGCERDRAGNRELHFDQYVKLVLLYTWNPLIHSVKGLQEAVGLARVAKAIGVKRFSAGSFSESVRVFEPERLKPILAELAAEMPQGQQDPRLDDVKHALTLVDGTVLTGLTRLARAAAGVGDDGIPDTRFNTARDGRGRYGWRLHTQLDLRTFTPHTLERTGARNAGENRENNVLRDHLESNRCYVCDGGFNDRRLFDDIVQAASSFVIRMAENTVLEDAELRPLSASATQAGVTLDAIVRPAGNQHPVRQIHVQVEPHPRRMRGGSRQVDRVILATSLLELPAELIALIYRQRYTVELFFRVFKQLLGMRHLLCERSEALDIQIYCAVIVCILIQQISGKKPSKSMRNIVGWYLMGIATSQELIDFLNRPDNTGVKLRAKDALWKKLGY